MTRSSHDAPVGRHFIHTALGMIVFQGLTFLAGVVMARQISPASVGRFQLLNTIAVCAGFIVKMGIDEGVAYKIPIYRLQAPEKTRALIRYALGATVIASIVLAGGFYIFADPLRAHVFTLPGFDRDLRLLVLLLPLTILLQMAMAALRGLGRTDLRAFVFYYLVGGSFVGALFIFAIGGLSLGETYAARLLSYALGGLVAVWLCFRCAPGGARVQLNRADIRELHAFSGILIFVWMFAYIVEQPLVDLVIVARVAPPDEVGIYGVAARVGSLVAIAMTAMGLVLGPAFADVVAAGDIARANVQYDRASKWMATLGLFSGLGVILFRRELLELFGHEYAHGESIVIVFATCHILVSQLGVNTPALLAAKFGRVELVLTAVSAVTMTGLGAFFGVAFGMVGVAAATSGTVVALALARRIAVSRLLFGSFNFRHLEVWFPGAIAFGACFALKQSLWGRSLLAVIGLGIIYVACFGGTFYVLGRARKEVPTA